MKVIRNAILKSLELLKARDGMLFDCPIESNAPYDSRKLHEVCINHRLALYLEQEIVPLFGNNEFFVDIEFNKEGVDFKEIKIDGHKKVVRPDIIIHNRKSGNDKKNILVVECKKKSTSQNDLKADVQKLKAFILDHRYQYKYGLQVVYDDQRIDAKLFFSENGSIKSESLK